MDVATASGSDGGVMMVLRERADEKEGSRESERGSRGLCGTVRMCRGGRAGRQGGAGLLGRARASMQLLLLAGGRRQEAPGGLGQLGWASWLRQVRPGRFPFSLFLFVSVF